MANSLSLFGLSSEWLKDDVYVHGVTAELQNIISTLGGASKVSQLLAVSYDSSKEWAMGRRSISLDKLSALLGLCSSELREGVIRKIDSSEIFLSCKYSPHRLKFPNEISPDLAYCVGVILGDGYLAGDSLNKVGNWRVCVYFDNKEHQAIFDAIIQKEFDIFPKHYQDSEHCFASEFCSKIFHWFIRGYFGVCNGYKSSRIFIPQNILESENDEIKSSFLQGLFDTDGTITKYGEVKYASTSKLIAEQVSELLGDFSIETRIGTWVKAEKYLPLYTVKLRFKDSVKRFAKLVNFRHPAKRNKLAFATLEINSPVV